ncbi:hypothetical protein [Lysinibacillus fusiformis]|uniref:hypothetical protein n=1 Tax=Lysinibacillus fusiformis TaxID=28031 RepID=UPI0012487CE5|nr:hypothetical protein [Lysinibacillus fusiformis]KAB0443270.1 hypothetical protein CH314_06430 [Lysinibacillus fusiformis]
MDNSNNQPFNLDIAIEGALGFEEAGRFMDKNFYTTYKGAISSAVNLALAVELNLKILYYLDHQKLASRTHKIVDFFNALNENTKTELINDFENYANANNTIDKETSALYKQYDNNLVAFLDYVSEVFVTWRYYGLDSTSPKESGTVGIDACLYALKKQIANHPNKVVSSL